jgi:lipopolysaccharide transport system ATP-binding protein
MDGDVILKVDNVSKLYRLGTLGVGTFRGDLQRFWKTKILGQDDPFTKVGQTNDRTSKDKSEFVWALKDINFEVNRGEVLGIIGKNGSGKSTLLKLLSRITNPTTGSVISSGRMASLLEVGTGFHPELTGRENIYLNGAIMGMTKKEIRQKFDEIVDFSGCELYIDTPTKRYSSGMTVRLGFAVAAFLDPEILVVDEVLAVGDAEFQKKAIGKMKEVSSGGGRTVLFVSHNMESIARLCSSCLLMENGMVKERGLTEAVIKKYLAVENFSNDSITNSNVIIGNILEIQKITINDLDLGLNSVHQGSSMNMGFLINNLTTDKVDVYFNIELKTLDGQSIGCFGNYFQKKDILIGESLSHVIIEIGETILKQGDYLVSIYVQVGGKIKSCNTYLEDFSALKVLPAIRKNANWNTYISQSQHGYNPILWNNIEVK